MPGVRSKLQKLECVSADFLLFVVSVYLPGAEWTSISNDRPTRDSACYTRPGSDDVARFISEPCKSDQASAIPCNLAVLFTALQGPMLCLILLSATGSVDKLRLIHLAWEILSLGFVSAPNLSCK